MTRTTSLFVVLVTGMLLTVCAPTDRRVVVELHGDVDREAVRIELFAFAIDSSESDAEPPLEGNISCAELLGRSDPFELPEAAASASFAPWDAQELGHLADGRYVILARAWAPGCRLAQQCIEVEVAPGVSNETRIALHDLGVEPRCPESFRCLDAECIPCGSCCVDVECNDLDPTTSDVCREGVCQQTTDLDNDGVDAPLDCDDRDATTYPGALPIDGAAVDHDCDGDVEAGDGTAAPHCWLGRVVEQVRRQDLQTWTLEVVGDVVIAALGDDSGAEIWLGRVLPGRLEELGRLALMSMEPTAQRPRDIVVLKETAFVLSSDGTWIHLIDISVPATPRELPALLLAHAASELELSPPLLWAVGAEGLEAFDISQISPARGWPSPVAGSTAAEIAPQHMHDRDGVRFILNGGSSVHCALPASRVDVAAVWEQCLDTISWEWSTGGIFSALHVTAERELILASGAGSNPELRGPLLWLFDLDASGWPNSPPNAAVVHGEPTHITVAGGTILRSTDQGLYLHRREGFSTLPETWTWVDVDTDGTAGPTVWDAAIVGRTAVLAAGTDGAVILSLDCVP